MRQARGIPKPFRNGVPGPAVMLTVMAFNFVGVGMREWLDPKQKRQ